MAQKMHARGTVLEFDSAGGTSWAAIGDLMAIQPPQKSRGTGETTVMDSANAYREFMKGWKDGQEATFSLRFHKSQFATLDTAFEDDTDAIPNWRISFKQLTGETTPSRFTFKGIITALGHPEVSVDGEDIWQVDVTMKLTGKPTFTAGS